MSEFNRVLIEGVGGEGNGVRFTSLDLSKTILPSDIDLNFNVVATDRDGDVTSTSAFTVFVDASPPIVLDLDGDGVEFVTAAAGASFDYNGDGNALATAWAGRDDGILALDANGNGGVDSGAEIIFGGGGLTDLEGIAAKYDSNHDGMLDASDSDFAKFGVWQDADGDGQSDAGEFRSLSDAGIVSLSLTSDGQAYSAAEGQVKVFGSTIFTRADGSTGTAADASLAVQSRAAQRTAELATTTAVAGAMLAVAGSAMPLAAQEAHDWSFSPVEVERVAIDRIDQTETARFEVNGELFAARADVDGRQAETIAHFRGEASSARLVSEDFARNEPATAPDYLADAASSIGGPSGSLFAGAGAGAEGMMEALLSLTAPQGHAPDLAADAPGSLQEALSDVTGEAMINGIVDHFAGRFDINALPLSANDDASHLLAQGIVGSGSFAGFAPMTDAGDDASALAAAQA
jgi:hypothetical protein